jgi:hypothetical protein
VLKIDKSVDYSCTLEAIPPPKDKYLHSHKRNNRSNIMIEILQSWVEISPCNISNKEAQILLLFNKIIKSGGSGGIFHTIAASTEKVQKDYGVNDNNHLTIKSKEILKLKLQILSFRKC